MRRPRKLIRMEVPRSARWPRRRERPRPYGRSMLSTPSTDLDSLAVQTIGLGKRFGSRAALDGVDLEVPRGVAFGFLGANGAGKTTLIRLLLGLAEPTAGCMRLLAHELPVGLVASRALGGGMIVGSGLQPDLS